MSDDYDEHGEYTRFKAKVQLGDGPDQRGEITVETVRERTDDGDTTTHEVDVPVGDEYDITATPRLDHNNFGEFYLELQRGRDALAEALDLDDE